MNVYVESNFILEIALRQEESEPANSILEHANRGKINLFIPAFSLAEPFWTLTHRSKNRKESLDVLAREQRTLSRSSEWEGFAELLGQFIDQTSVIEETERNELEQISRDILTPAHVIEFSAPVFEAALSFSMQLGLGMQDAIVFASVHEHLANSTERTRSVFISRDRKDLGNPLITQRLRELGCSYVPTFGNGLELISGNI